MNGTYLTLAGRIRQELSDLERVVERTLAIWERGATAADNYYLDAAALNLHGFYAGLERIFELIAEQVDSSRPAGSSWHRDLLRQMAAEVPHTRPAVIGVASRDQLDRYRGFRHVVRNVYTFNFDREQIAILIGHLRQTATQVGQDLERFADFLDQTASPKP